MYRSRRMTDGSLKLNETERISRSYTRTTSTLPWHQSVTAFCQCTTLSGSYVAFNSSVCSIARQAAKTCVGILPDRYNECQDRDAGKHLYRRVVSGVVHFRATEITGVRLPRRALVLVAAAALT